MGILIYNNSSLVTQYAFIVSFKRAINFFAEKNSLSKLSDNISISYTEPFKGNKRTTKLLILQDDNP